MVALGFLDYNHSDLTHPLEDGHPRGPCPRVVAQRTAVSAHFLTRDPRGARPPSITKLCPLSRGSRQKGRGFRHPQGHIGPAVVRQKPRLTQGEGASAEYRGEEAELRILEDSEEGVKSGPAAESRT